MFKNKDVQKGHQYALDIFDNKILACKWVKLACQNYLDDLKDSENYYFDEEAAAHVLRFCHAFTHVKGEWANKPIVLEPWQCFILINLYGWKRKQDDTRRYRKGVLFVSRKNGKSLLAACIALYGLVADNEAGAEIYCGAKTQRQSKEVMRPAQAMARKNKDFLEYYDGVEVTADTILDNNSNSKFEMLIGNPLDGGNPSLAILDELHQHPNSNMYETMLTGMGARKQPIMLIITTAGTNLNSFCFSMFRESQKKVEGTLSNDDQFTMIYTLDEGDDWRDTDNLIKSNPNMDVSVSQEFLEKQIQEAINSPSRVSDVKTKHLNLWHGTKEGYFNMEKWFSCADESLRIEDFYNRKAFLGLDLSETDDITAINVLIPEKDGEFITFSFHYLPEAKCVPSESNNYMGWVQDGYINTNEGDVIDYDFIQSEIEQLCKDFDVVEICYDPHFAKMLVQQLQKLGLPVIEIGQTMKNMNAPMTHLDMLIKQGKIKHNNNPCFTWQMSNVIEKVYNDIRRPDKERNVNKIDAAVALITAMNRAMDYDNSDDDFDDFIDNMISVNL